MRAKGLFLCVLAAVNAYGDSITIDGTTLTGSTSILFGGTFNDLTVVPSSQGVLPLVSFIDTPTFKFISMTNFALLPTSPIAFNTAQTIVVQHSFTPFLSPVVGFGFIGMGGSYINEGNLLIIGGEVRARGFINNNQVNGTVINSIFTPPIFVPGANELIYHPADDIRFRGGNLAQHSCDNIIGQPPQFLCGVSEFFFLPPGPLNVRIELDVTFVDSDRFVFPGSVDSAFEVVPEPSSWLLCGLGLVSVAARYQRWRRRAKTRLN